MVIASGTTWWDRLGSGATSSTRVGERPRRPLPLRSTRDPGSSGGRAFDQWNGTAPPQPPGQQQRAPPWWVYNGSLPLHGRRMSAADSNGPVIDDARPMGQCECSFVDIGLNNGNTLKAWWRDQSALAALPSAQARRLQACTADLSARSHCYWGMEANPRWTVALRALEARMRAKGHRVQLLTETALSTHDGEATFYVERNLKSSPGLDASLEAERGVHYKDRSGWHWALNSTLRESSAFVPVRVRTVAAGPFLERLVSTSSFVAIKIDIEGSEFRVLRHVLLTQPGVLCRLNVLAVEWHGTLLQHHVPANLTQAFQWLLAGCNVGHVSWH